MNSVFLNSAGRLRSGWRFLIFLFSFLFASSLLGAGVYTFLINQPVGFDQNGLLFLIAGSFLSFLCAVVLGWICGKYFEDLPFQALGWTFSKRSFAHLILGLASGAFAILLAAGIAYAFGGLSFQFNHTAGTSAIGLTLSVSLFIFIIAAASEEAIFRGYMLQTFTRAKLAWLGVILTSVLFASAHVGNPSANILSWVNTFLAGILFAVGYLKTRTLWLPFGLHLIWNWVQGSILGITVSGLKQLITAPLYQWQDYGPQWLTGGEYGIEGGIACSIALVVTTLLIWFSPIFKPSTEMLALTDNEKPVATHEMK